MLDGCVYGCACIYNECIYNICGCASVCVCMCLVCIWWVCMCVYVVGVPMCIHMCVHVSGMYMVGIWGHACVYKYMYIYL